MSFLHKMFDGSKRDVNRYRKRAKKINALEPTMEMLSDEELKNKTIEFKERLLQGEKLDNLLIEAFAVVREASKRTLKMRHYDVQLIGGMALHEGKISEMRTGEGKTLVSTLPAYLNALTGDGVHIITVNEYLATRDSEEMKKIFNFLGITVGLNLNSLSKHEKKEAYQADIIYGTNSEFGFDYLRDNMVLFKEEKVQRGLQYAIIDEVDSILIDEARTPLIISGSSDESSELYISANAFVRTLNENDYTYDVKDKTVQLTEVGMSKAEKNFGVKNLFDVSNITLFHHVNVALKAHYVMQKDIDYVVQEDEIMIVDSFTGRIMPGKRYSDGLHQALEAKENVSIQRESITLATITYQNYFRMYKKLSGMTGTAKTEEEEFRNIYKMNVLVIPTNKAIQRNDLPDLIYKTKEAKFNAVIEEIKVRHKNNQPILVGTADIETSEYLSSLLTKKGIKHNVLNAKQHDKEADIIALAGQKGAVTISTNMAGRGTDIKLEEGVEDLGGLAVIGTERHESRRIDNQLRGRSGRQGDKGVSRFFVSTEDELMIRFGSDNVKNMMEKLGFNDSDPIESRMITKALERAQKRVEGNNFDTRKQLLKYDDVLNEQRNIIYRQRDLVLSEENVSHMIEDMVKAVLGRYTEHYFKNDEPEEECDYEGYIEKIHNTFFEHKTLKVEDLQNKTYKEIYSFVEQKIFDVYKEREEKYAQYIREFEKVILLKTVDGNWIEHIDAMMLLRQGIHLRAYAQTDPLREYQFESFQMFDALISKIEEETCLVIFKSTIYEEVERKRVVDEDKMQTSEQTNAKPKQAKSDKVQRNQPCPCGSGKKYKNCHGKK